MADYEEKSIENPRKVAKIPETDPFPPSQNGRIRREDKDKTSGDNHRETWDVNWPVAFHLMAENCYIFSGDNATLYLLNRPDILFLVSFCRWYRSAIFKQQKTTSSTSVERRRELRRRKEEGRWNKCNNINFDFNSYLNIKIWNMETLQRCPFTLHSGRRFNRFNFDSNFVCEYQNLKYGNIATLPVHFA